MRSALLALAAVASPVAAADPPAVTAKAWAMYDGATGAYLAGKAADDPLKAASTTKITCATVVLGLAAKDPKVLDEAVTFSKLAAATPGSTAAIKAGESLPVKDCLYALLLPSGNDVGNAFAEHFHARLAPPDADLVKRAGLDADALKTRANFIAEMNRTAAALGLKNTVYRSPYGDGGTPSDRTTTARDLGVVALNALKDARFREVVGTKTFTCQVTKPGGGTRPATWENTNKLLARPGYDGVKTGTTDQARACLVSSGRRGADHRLMVVLGSEKEDDRYTDTEALFKWAWATTPPAPAFHVAPNGNDAWTGTLAEPSAAKTDGPFATPARGRDAARAARKAGTPTRVYVRGGRYELAEPLAFTPDDTGTAAVPQVFAAYPGEVPVLSGGTRVEPKVENGLWVVPVPAAVGPIRHISVGGELRLASRWPKEGTFTISGLAGADPKGNYRTAADRFQFADGQIDPAWKNLPDVEVVVLHYWVAGRYRIKAVDPAAKVVTLDRKSIRRFTEGGPGPDLARFYLVNAPVELAPGEFVHDRPAGVIRYKPKPTDTPDVVIPRLETVVRFNGRPDAGKFVEHVEFRGFTLCDTVFRDDGMAAGDLQAAQHVRGSVLLKGARNCVLAGCWLVNLGGYGVELADGCRGNRVTGNTLRDLAAGGIRLSGGAAGSPEGMRTGENVIADNALSDLGKVFPAGVGILSQHADHNRIVHNHVHHGYYTGISVGWVWGYGPSVSVGNVVEGNRIHDIGRKVLSDMGGIYMLGVSPGTVVRGNVIHDVESFGYGGWGVYTDEGSTGITVENNLVYRTKSGGFHQHYGRDNVVRNNVFALAREGQVMRSRMEPHVSFAFERNIVYADGSPLYAKNWKDDKFVTDHNLFWDAANTSPAFPGGTLKDWQARGHDVHSLVADPLFVDVAKGDSRLKPGSSALKMGFVPFDTSTAGVRLRGE